MPPDEHSSGPLQRLRQKPFPVSQVSPGAVPCASLVHDLKQVLRNGEMKLSHEYPVGQSPLTLQK